MKIQWTKRQRLLTLGAALLALGLNGCNGDANSTKCSAGHHIAANGECEKNTDERCGKRDSADTRNCTTYGNAIAGVCNPNGECVATECIADYHLSSGACHKDSELACGETKTDCTKQFGWGGGGAQMASAPQRPARKISA